MNNKLLNRGVNIISSITGIVEKEARILLDKSNGFVKNAIVMEMLGIPFNESCELLSKYDGSLRKVLNKCD